MITLDKLDTMLAEMNKQEEELLAQLNKVAGAKDTLNHLRTYLITELELDKGVEL